MVFEGSELLEDLHGKLQHLEELLLLREGGGEEKRETERQ